MRMKVSQDIHHEEEKGRLGGGAESHLVKLHEVKYLNP